MTVAQAIVELLREEGVTLVFGVPGGQTLPLMDALYGRDDIRFVTARHEMAAAHMADGYGRLTRRLGVCLVTAGPGATNAITGIAGAFRDSSPVLLITVNNNRKDVGWDDAQDADHSALLSPVTKSSRYVNDERSVVRTMREAFRISQTGNPGAVHVDIARDVLEDGEVDVDIVPPYGYRPMDDIEPSEMAVAKVIDLLRSASRPVLWVGNGVRIAAAGAIAMQFAERQHMPVVTTFNGIGAVPMTDPLVFGPLSRSGTRLAEQVLSESDLVIVVGNSLNAISTNRWRLPLPNLVQVDVDPYAIGKHYPVLASVWSGAHSFLDKALAKSPSVVPERKDWLAHLHELRIEWTREVFAAPEQEGAIRPVQVVTALIDRMHEDDIIVVDAGNPGIWAHLLPITRSDGFMKPVGFGNMGFALPAAIAAKIAAPDRRVIVLVGDGSLGMSLAELETAVREKAAVSIILLNDSAYGNIKQEEEHKYGPRYIGVDFGPTEYADVARAMGADGETVLDDVALGGALDRALSSKGPYLADVRIDGSISVWRRPI
jgi:acetolactate synthase-1/2/3 large subunit